MFSKSGFSFTLTFFVLEMFLVFTEIEVILSCGKQNHPVVLDLCGRGTPYSLFSFEEMNFSRAFIVV